MPRRYHYSEPQIQDTLDLYRSIEQSGNHLRKGVKDHMVNILRYTYPSVYRKDVNNILDILHERGLVGDHHVVAQTHEPIKGAGRGYFAAVSKDRLVENIRTYKPVMSITPGVHKILCIPDAHATVGLTNERFAWAGRLAAERRPEYIVQIGDWGSWDCFSSHEKVGTVSFSKKPSFAQELPVFRDSVQQFELHLPKKYKPRKHITYGNHEFRCSLYEDSNPTCLGTFSSQIEDVFESAGWGWSPYGSKIYIEGVMFTHRPFNTMGKPESLAAVRREALTDVYMGHDHRRFEEAVPKQDGHITLISGGCFMPEGYEPHYAESALTGWWYGCQILTVENGKIRETEWISMRTLEEKYGDRKNGND